MATSPSLGKLYFICKAENEPAARQDFESFGLEINYLRGQQYLGGFMGSTALSLLLNLEAAQQGRSMLFSDEQKLLFEGRKKRFA